MATKDSSELNNSSCEEYFWEAIQLYQYQGFWFTGKRLDHVRVLQEQFQAREDDILLASSMKTGTTWLKALCHCIMRSSNLEGDDDDDQEGDVLHKKSPHDCVLTLDGMNPKDDVQGVFSGMPSPRLFHAHIPFSVLPESIKNSSSCRIVYITRNPKDTLVSMWHFFNKVWRPNQPAFPLEKAVDSFCRGFHLFGPFHEHVLEFWEASIRMPHRVLFLKYEDLQRDPKGEVKRLASFLGRPLKDEVDKVLWRCSLGRLKEMEVNKNGTYFGTLVEIPNTAFFRVGGVGDWKNYLTQDMIERIDKLTREKFEGTGLYLEA